MDRSDYRRHIRWGIRSIYAFVAPALFVTGAPNLVKLLTEDIGNPDRSRIRTRRRSTRGAQTSKAHIMKKRAELGIKNTVCQEEFADGTFFFTF